MHNFRELNIWKDSVEMAAVVFSLTKSFPAEERYSLTSQINRSVVSIASNIAEGSARKSNKDFSRFLEMALGSCFELETQLIIANKFGYTDEKQFLELSSKIQLIQKMISSFKEKLT